MLSILPLFLVFYFIIFIVEYKLSRKASKFSFIHVISSRISTTLIVVSFLCFCALYAISDVIIHDVENNLLMIAKHTQNYEYYGSKNELSLLRLLYGPLGYFLIAFLQNLDTGINALKISSFIAVTISLITLYISSKSIKDKKTSIITLNLILLFWIATGSYSFTRFDPLLLAATSTSVCICIAYFKSNYKLPYFFLPLTISILISAAVNIKIHGFLYFLPLIYFLLAQYSLRLVIMTLVMTGILSALPFILSPNLFVTYISVLSLAAVHGLDYGILLKSTGWVTVVVICFSATILSTNFTSIHAKVFIGVCAFSMMIILLVSSKAGSGYWHITPFLPMSFLYWALVETKSA